MRSFLKRIIQSGFNTIGLEVRRKQKKLIPISQPHEPMHTLRTDLKMILEYTVGLGFNPKTVIDVGVGYGTPELYSSFPYARHLLIEPLQEFEPQLRKICEQYQASYILAVADEKAGVAHISVGSHLEGSSLLYSGDTERTIPAVTLDEVCANEWPGPYLLKVDVQGAELRVIAGAQKILKDTELVVLEVSFFQFATGMPQFYEVVQHMKELGYVVYDIFGGHNRPLDWARAQADVVFVKENGFFRSSHLWATPQQTEAFHNQYR